MVLKSDKFLFATFSLGAFGGWLKIVMTRKRYIVGNVVLVGIWMRICGLTLRLISVIDAFEGNRSSGKTCVANI